MQRVIELMCVLFVIMTVVSAVVEIGRLAG